MTDPDEYNRDLNEKEKTELLQAMIKRENENKDDDNESSVGRITSRMSSSNKGNTKGGGQTFNIMPAINPNQRRHETSLAISKANSNSIPNQPHRGNVAASTMISTVVSAGSDLNQRPQLLIDGNLKNTI